MNGPLSRNSLVREFHIFSEFRIICHYFPVCNTVLHEPDCMIPGVCLCLSMGRNTDIDTTAFRHAIWHYVHCIYGVRHDDYNYGVISDLLEKSVRCFIKLIACFPEKTSSRDYRHFMTGFMQSEKVTYDSCLISL